jgi:UDP-N-acetylmuramate dehydrogenase
MAERSYPGVDHLASALKAILGPESIREKQSLARFTSFRIGGPADLVVIVEHVTALRQAVTLAWQQEIPCWVLGGGSNILVSDEGVRGVVVLNRARATTFPPPPASEGPQHTDDEVPGEVEVVRAESGASFSTVARRCVARGLSGLEWAVGIPGTVGGAVVGNAGAWGSDVASTLIEATILEPGGAVTRWPAKQFRYGYRSSVLKQQAQSLGVEAPYVRRRQRPVVLEAEFALQEADRAALDERLAEIVSRRKASQPGGATCGSVFKNPPGDFAGRLVEAAGLKGQRSGSAEISPVHANFIINHGDAAAADVKALIDLARRTVHAQSGVALELEIELVGVWPDSVSVPIA